MGLDLLKDIRFEGGEGMPRKNEEETRRWAVAQTQMMAQ